MDLGPGARAVFAHVRRQLVTTPRTRSQQAARLRPRKALVLAPWAPTDATVEAPIGQQASRPPRTVTSCTLATLRQRRAGGTAFRSEPSCHGTGAPWGLHRRQGSNRALASLHPPRRVGKKTVVVVARQHPSKFHHPTRAHPTRGTHASSSWPEGHLPRGRPRPKETDATERIPPSNHGDLDATTKGATGIRDHIRLLDAMERVTTV